MKIIPGEHPDEEILEEYVRHKLPPSEELKVEEHLLACPSCLEAVRESETLLAGLDLAFDEQFAGLVQSHLPLYSLEAAAGRFGRKQIVAEPERWVEIPPIHRSNLTESMFAVHVKGFSMEPSITDGSLCVFESSVEPPFEGKVVLLEQYEEQGGNRYTIKRYHSSTNPDPNRKGDAAWLHERMTLESTNTNFQDWDVASAGKVDVIGEFMFTL